MKTTICAISTAQGGAIGIIRVSGPEAIAIIDGIFCGRHSVADAKGYSVHYGQIVDQTASDSFCIDDVLVTIFRAPHSYTGEDSAEISCHGSSYILQSIIKLLIANGCTLAEPGEYTQRAFLNGKMDLSQAEAVADLIASQNEAQHRVAMSQMRGGISAKLSELRNELLHLTSLLELELDFSDHEDLEFADRTELLHLAETISTEIAQLSDTFDNGNALKNGVPVAIIGAPNVGKSTLLNALLKEERAIVSDIQGTTRDTIEDTITLGGYLLRFIDTAGIRHTDDAIEQLGIERSMKAAEKAQIIILLTEPSVPFPDIETSDNQYVIRIVNKTDTFQALSGIGISSLEQQLITICQSLFTTNDDTPLITNLRHKQALELAHTDISRALEALRQSLSGDLISEDLRQCLHHLSEITGGEITPDEVLGNIFKHFCIGK